MSNATIDIQRAVLSTVLHWDLSSGTEKIAMFKLDAGFFDKRYEPIINAISVLQKDNICPDFLMVAHNLKDTEYEYHVLDVGSANSLGSYDSLVAYYEELKKSKIKSSLSELRYWYKYLRGIMQICLLP